MCSKMDTFCGCIDLRTGCFIIGYLQVLFVEMLVIRQGFETLETALLFSVNRHDSPRALLILIWNVIILLYLVLALGFIITLLVGVHKNKPGHIEAYLVFGYICIVLALIYQVVLFTQQDVKAIFIRFISFCINLYFHMVIKTYHDKLCEDNAQGTIVSSAQPPTGHDQAQACYSAQVPAINSTQAPVPIYNFQVPPQGHSTQTLTTQAPTEHNQTQAGFIAHGPASYCTQAPVPIYNNQAPPHGHCSQIPNRYSFHSGYNTQAPHPSNNTNIPPSYSSVQSSDIHGFDTKIPMVKSAKEQL